MDAGTVEGTVAIRDLATAALERIGAQFMIFGKQVQAAATQATVASTAATAATTKYLTSTGYSMIMTGRLMTWGLTFPMVAAGVATAKFASDFEAAMMKIQVLAGVSADKIDDFRESILRMATETATGPRELAAALYVVTSAGIRTEQALEITRLSALGAAMGMGEAADIARSLTTIMTSYGKSAVTAEQAMDMMFVTVREGAAESEALAPVIGRVTGVAQQLGVQFDEVGAYLATFTRLGVTAREAVTSLGAVFTNVLNATPEATNALAAAGWSIKGFRDSIVQSGLAATLLELQNRLRGNDAAMQSIFGNVRALRGVLGNTGAQAKAYAEIIKLIAQSHGEFGRGAELMKNTIQFQWRQVVAEIERAAIKIGTATRPITENLIKAIRDVVPYLEKMANAFAALPTPVQKGVFYITALVAVLGPLIWFLEGAAFVIAHLAGSKGFMAIAGAIPAVVKGLIELVKWTAAFGKAGAATIIGEWIAGVPGLITALRGAAVAFQYLVSAAKVAGSVLAAVFTSPVTAIVAALAAAALAVRYFTGSWEFLTGPVGRVLSLMSDLYVVIKDRAGKALSDFGALIARTAGYISSNFGAGIKSIYDFISNQLQGALKLVASTFGSVKDAAVLVGTWIDYLAGRFNELKTKLYDAFPVLYEFDKWAEIIKNKIYGLGGAFDDVADGFAIFAALAAASTGDFSKLVTIMASQGTAQSGWRKILADSANEVRAQGKAAQSTSTDLKGLGIAWNPAIQGALDYNQQAGNLSGTTRSMVEQLAAAKAAVGQLTDEQKRNIQAGLEIPGMSTRDIVAQLQVLWPEVEWTEAMVGLYAATLKDADKSSKKLATAVNHLVEQFKMTKAISEFIELLKVLQQMGGGSFMAGLAAAPSDALSTARDMADKLLVAYESLGSRAPAALSAIVPVLRAVYAESVRLMAVREGESGYAKVAREIEATLPVIRNLSNATDDQLKGWMDGINAAIEANRRIGAEVPAAWYATKDAILEAQLTQHALNVEFEDVVKRIHGLKPPEELAAGIQRASEATLRWLQSLNQVDAQMGKIQARNMGGELGEGLFDWAAQYQEELQKINYGMDEFGNVTELGRQAVEALNRSAVAKLEEMASAAGLTVDGFGSMLDLLARIVMLIPGLDLSSVLTPEVVARLQQLQGMMTTPPKKNAFTKFFKDAFGSFGDFGKDLADKIVGAFRGGGDVGRTIGGAIFGDLGSAAGNIFSGAAKELGGKAGAIFGAIGGALGPLGAALGGMLGDVIGKLFGPSKGKLLGMEADKEIASLQDKLLETYGSLDGIRKAGGAAGEALAAAWGDKNVAGLAHFKQLMDEFNKSVEDHKELIEDLIDDLGKLAEANELLPKDIILNLKAHIDDEGVKEALYEFVKSSTASAVEGIGAFINIRPAILESLKDAQKELDDLLKQADDLSKQIAGLESESYLTPEQEQELRQARDHMSILNIEIGKLRKSISGAGAAMSSLVLSPETAGALQAAVSGMYGQLLAQGESPLAAITQLSPMIEELGDQLRELGLPMSPAFAELASMSAMFSDKVTGPILTAIAGLGQGLVGLHNAGLLTNEMFTGLARGAYDAFHALEVQGKGGTDAVRGMQPTLQRIWELQQDYGYEVDENTQKLLDFAAANGLIGEQFRPAADKMLAALEMIAAKFDIIIQILERALPESAANGAQEVNNALDQIDFESMASRAEDAFARVEDAATGAAEGHSPTGIRQIVVVTEEAIAKLRQFGDYATLVFESTEDMAAAYAHTAVNSADDLGKLIQGMSYELEDLVATPLQRTLNGIDRTLMSTLQNLGKYKDDPRYDQAVDLAQQVADIQSRQAVWEARNKAAAEMQEGGLTTLPNVIRRPPELDAATPGSRFSWGQYDNRPVTVQVVLDGRVLAETVMREVPGLAPGYGV